MSDGDLKSAPGTEPVLLARLVRKSYDLPTRDKAITELAKLHKTDKVSELVASLGRVDALGSIAATSAEELAKMLAMTAPSELGKVRAGLSGLAEKATLAPVRHAAWASLVLADGNADATWAVAKDDASRQSLVDAIGLIPDPMLRAKFQPLLTAALADAGLNGGVRSAALKALPLMGADHAKANFPVLATALRDGKDRTNAARAIMQLPRDSWDKAAAAPVAESILAWAKTVAAGNRTRQDFVETVQTGMEFASLLPAEDAARIRKELRGLGVSVFVIKTVREQMRYDTPRLVVEAGKPFEVIVENMDAMPHNIVFVEPGTRQKVAESVQTMAPTKLDKQGRAYVPDKDKRVLEASKMIEPGKKETLKIKAPATEGEYEYVCTFPGHWMIMWGKLIVTKDVDGYLQKHPQAEQPAIGGVAVDHRAHQPAAK